MLSQKKVMELKKLRKYVSNNIYGMTMDDIINYIKTREKRIDTFEYNEDSKFYPVLKKLWFNHEYNYSFNGFCTDILLTSKVYHSVNDFAEFCEDYKFVGGSCIGTNLAIYHSHEYKATIKFDLNYEKVTYIAMSVTIMNKDIFEELKATHPNFNFEYIDATH